MGVSDDDGGVEDEGAMLIALQGRIVALETLTKALLIDLVGRHAGTADTSAEAAAERFKKILVASAQHQQFPSEAGEYGDLVWEEAGKALTGHLDNLIVTARALDN
jgi:hypothetical protein